MTWLGKILDQHELLACAIGLAKLHNGTLYYRSHFSAQEKTATSW